MSRDRKTALLFAVLALAFLVTTVATILGRMR